jgi:hypothetical protein
MRPKAHIAVLRSLACILLCSGSLLAKPTRSLAHDSVRKPVISTPSWHDVSHARTTHRPANAPLTAHATWTERGAAHLADQSAHASTHLTPTAPGRAVKQPLIANHAEVRAETAYAAADSATIDRVHIWELTHRNPPATHAVAGPSTKSAAPAGNDILSDNSSSSGLLRTTPELPRVKSIEEEAVTPVLLPSLYDKRGHLIVPAPLYGSHDVLVHQNQMADRDGLGRVQDDADLLDLRRDRKLVALPANETLRVDERLPANRRFSRPWTAEFLSVLARDYYASFHEPLQVNSAVRTVEFQRRLLRTNGNAAPAAGETASPHLTGQAIDIGKRGLTLTEIAWMRTYLEPLIDEGKIDVEEEFQQSCFHISVYRNYLPPVPAHVTVATRQLQADPFQ